MVRIASKEPTEAEAGGLRITLSSATGELPTPAKAVEARVATRVQNLRLEAYKEEERELLAQKEQIDKQLEWIRGIIYPNRSNGTKGQRRPTEFRKNLTRHLRNMFRDNKGHSLSMSRIKDEANSFAGSEVSYSQLHTVLSDLKKELKLTRSGNTQNTAYGLL